MLVGILISGVAQPGFGQNGTGWDDGIVPGEIKMIEEDFTGFPFFHSDANPNEGNSDNTLDAMGYKDTTTFRVAINSTDTIFYEFYQCAFAPAWQPAYGYRDSADGISPPVPPLLSRGFIEISRFDTIYSSAGQDSGYFIIDMRRAEYVEVIKYSHSSTGGNKRGFTLRKSNDDGATWDTVRYQDGTMDGNIAPWTAGNNISGLNDNCQNSAYGMLWQDNVYFYDQNLMLKFSFARGQTPRIHDFIAYGWIQQVGVDEKELEAISIYNVNKNLFLSEPSDIVIFDMNGRFVKKALHVETYSMADLPEGLYIVKARNDKGIVSRKIMNQ